MSDTFDGSNPDAEQIDQDVQNNIAAAAATVVTTITYSAAHGFPAVTSGIDGVTFVQGATVALPTGYDVVTTDAGVPVSLFGNGDAVAAVSAAGGGLTYFAAGSEAYVFTGDDGARGAAHGDVIYLDGTAGSEVAAGEGHDTVIAAGGDNTIATGTGSNLVFLIAGDNYVAGEGADTVIGNGGNNTVTAGKGAMLVFGGTGSLYFVDGSGASTVVGGESASTIYGGTAGGTYFAQGGGNYIDAGTGPSVVVGSGDGDSITSSSAANDLFVAGGGGELLDASASTGDNVMFGGTGPDIINAGGGSDTIIGGSGAATINLLTGNTVVFAGVAATAITVQEGQAGGTDDVLGFRSGVDQLLLSGYADGAASAALASATTAYGSTQVVLADGTDVWFIGTTHLSSGDIASG